MTSIKKPLRTQKFNCKEDGNPPADRPGRYLAWPEGATRPVFRWWTGESWQYNRRKKGTAAGFGSRPGDAWAGAAELHPLAEKEMKLYKELGDKQPVKLHSGASVVSSVSPMVKQALFNVMQ